ncbi:MAG: hypothetical protein AAF004_07430 [Pseudomonadota bacterium]
MNVKVLRAALITVAAFMSVPSLAALKAADLTDRAAVIEYASHTADVAYLATLSQSLGDEKARGKLEKLPHYYAALAAYRAAELDEDIELRVGVLLDRCVDEARKAIKIDPEFSEAMALAGACHGLAAARQPLSAIISGNFSARELKRAVKAAPENPRVLLLHAATLLRRYDDQGRVAQARDTLYRALSIFERFEDQPADGFPSWGEARVHLWLSRVATLTGDATAARDHLEQALLIAPALKPAKQMLAAIGR